ncbi:tRNA (adenosine(37)-N6)-threonylcarbamoyltransferase complex ATPase subunit type 1 TsaE [Candidatus Finniella inopinata]|uniref:tRNA threonylcarbamoyladenosine biosynthesis protein TsaE n=1 Tax=Candidatus Finniella inopinata TaxID=1696036 RepID=A0A4V2E023_9PROT|nr:tRNA (adenosine(37)-N6)-threonylcarbamoyltransferase complex ATPase subunit type 1 TsaE [Candidatus Finniella inopinata]RZI47057.1 tRNA (adenosine(37)-N6)-threonylcarbamoyltransferase complex ATPase subunit type 1 TsaE [Candidatus Finniella inopinata]
MKNLTQPQLEEQAHFLATAVAAPCVIALWGDMGAGKSTFARAFIQSLLPTTDVPSPTFTLIQTYDTPKGEIWHCDLYRLKGPEDAEELGLLEAFNQHICLIEWPERLGDFLPDFRYNIYIKVSDIDQRSCKIECPL